jgi:hypothetical protein
MPYFPLASQEAPLNVPRTMIATQRDHPHLARHTFLHIRLIIQANRTTHGIKVTQVTLRITSRSLIQQLTRHIHSTGLRIAIPRFMSAILNITRQLMCTRNMCLPIKLQFMSSPLMLLLRLLALRVRFQNTPYQSIEVSNSESRCSTNISTSRWPRQSMGRPMPSPLPFLGQQLRLQRNLRFPNRQLQRRNIPLSEHSF